MAINIHPADALIHRLLQQQGSTSNHRSSHQQKSDAGTAEKVTISEHARNAARSEYTSSLEPNLFQLYGPQAG